MVRGRSEAETRLEHRLECVIYGRWSSGNGDALIEVYHLATGPWAMKEVHQFEIPWGTFGRYRRLGLLMNGMQNR